MPNKPKSKLKRLNFDRLTNPIYKVPQPPTIVGGYKNRPMQYCKGV